MKRVVVDTNVLISFLTDRDPKQQARAAALFEAAADGQLQLILHQIVVTELVYVLANLYKMDNATIASILADLLISPGVAPVDEVIWTQVLKLWPERVGDFADAVLASVAMQARYDAVATFDRRFAGSLRRQGIKSHWAFEGKDS